MAEQDDRIRRVIEALESLDTRSEQPDEPIPIGADQPLEQKSRRVGRQAVVPDAESDKSEKAGRTACPALLPRRLTEPSRISLRRTAIPVLLSTGFGMLLLGCWAISVLALGFDPVRPTPAEQSKPLARLMLLAWPTGLILLAGAGIFMRDVARWYKNAYRTD